jgi:metal-sulfur cluster biosynthetic enzyme/Fe-S cluster assembly iron-binding protein IscA
MCPRPEFLVPQPPASDPGVASGEPRGIEVTLRAAEQILGAMAAEGLDPERSVVRVAVKVRQGEQIHSLDLLSDWCDPEDVLTGSHGIRLVCRSRDWGLLRGMTLDFCDDQRGRGFVFRSATTQRNSTEMGRDDPPDEHAVREALKGVIDPEIGVNIVDLGLVYRVELGGHRVHVTMTMTTPACPLSAQIEQDARRCIHERCPGISEVKIELVWSPLWNPQMMSDEAKQQMGWGKR